MVHMVLIDMKFSRMMTLKFLDTSRLSIVLLQKRRVKRQTISKFPIITLVDKVCRDKSCKYTQKLSFVSR